jgi:hypothetical protein
MNDVAAPTALDFERYAIGRPVPRSEDPVLVRRQEAVHRRCQPVRPDPTPSSWAAAMRTV